jgi:hypothetical protein
MTLRRLTNDEAGFAGGAEALAFGVLIFVVGTLLFANTWAVIDAKFATSAAAREAVRAAVTSPPGQDPAAAADAAARLALVGHGLDPDQAAIVPSVDLSGGLDRCQDVEVTVSYRVAAIGLPLVRRQQAGFDVTGQHREVVDPFRAGLALGGSCAF